MGERFDVNDDAFPIVVTRCPAHFTEADVDRYRDDYLAVLRRGEPLVSIVDTRDCLEFMSADSRRRLARVGEQTERERHVVRAIVVLGTDVLVRASIRAMHWLAKPAQPVLFVASEDEALHLALEVLEAHGISRPMDVEVALALLRRDD